MSRNSDERIDNKLFDCFKNQKSDQREKSNVNAFPIILRKRIAMKIFETAMSDECVLQPTKKSIFSGDYEMHS